MKKTYLTVLIFLASACSSMSTANRDGHFDLRPFQEETLDNGLRILWVQDDSLPRISMNMMVEVGSIDESGGHAGLNSFTAAMLNKGTARHSSPQLAEALDQLGADFSSQASTDFTDLSVSGLSTTRVDLLGLFAEVILTPAFQDAEIERERSVLLSSIQKSSDEPTTFADERIGREIFGEHPYGTPSYGKLKTVQGFKRADLIRQYYAFYRPNNSMLAVVGHFDDPFRQAVRHAFQGWSRGDIKREAHKPASARASRIVLLNKAGLQQTQIRMGQIGIPRSSKDFMALRLANIILGGDFSSRLNQKIRDDMGLTYSISSSSATGLEAGPFEISTFTRHEKVADTILETRKMVDEFVQRGVNDEELKAAKALMIGQFPASLETADRVAYNLLVLRRYGIPDDYLRFFQRDVQAITKDQVNDAIRRHLHPQQLQVLIYTDESALGNQLGRLGPIEKAKVE